MPRDQFNKECIKTFLITSLNGFPLDTIITYGYRTYLQIIDEIGAKHQLYIFHIMGNLMKLINKRIHILERKIKSFKKNRRKQPKNTEIKSTMSLQTRWAVKRRQ